MLNIYKNQRFRSFAHPTPKCTDEGNTRTVEHGRRIKQGWFVSKAGDVCFSVRYGSRVLALAKVKSAIEVTTPAELINSLRSVFDA